MTGVAGVFDNFLGLPLTPPGVEVLDDRQLSPSDVLGRTHHPLLLLCLAVRGRAVAVPGSDAKHALDGAAVEPCLTACMMTSFSHDWPIWVMFFLA